MWGEASVEQHRLQRDVGSAGLWQNPTMEQVLDLLERDQLWSAARSFPLHRGTTPTSKDPANNTADGASTTDTLRDSSPIMPVKSHPDTSKAYDPCFLLPLLAHLVGPGTLRL